MLFYLIVYLIMNLGAFAVVALLRNLTHSEDLADFRGMVYRNPLLVVCLAVFLLSLLGMPPLAGFVAKFQIFSVLFDGAKDFSRHGQPGLQHPLYSAGDRRSEHGAEPVLLCEGAEGDDSGSAAGGRREPDRSPSLPTPAIANVYLCILAIADSGSGHLLEPAVGGQFSKGVISFKQPPYAPTAPRIAQGATP